MDPIVESFLANEMVSLSVLPDQFDMASLIQDFALADSLNTIDYPWTNAFELPSPVGSYDMQQAMIIPDAGTGIPFLFAVPVIGFMRRRRNT